MQTGARVATVDVVTDVAGLAGVEHTWRALAETRGNAFISPEWFRAWLTSQDGETVPWVVVLRDGAKVQGLLPLVTSRRERPRRLRFSGGPFGDYFQPVAAAADEEAVARAAAMAFAEKRDEWAAVILDNVDVAAPWVEVLRAATQPRLVTIEDHRQPLPYIDLAPVSSWEDYVASRSSKLRAQLRRELRVLERDHTVRFRLTRGVDELPADLASFFDLHARRWQTR